MRPRRPTIFDVAERAGVSKSLVSLVLRGKPGVSEARRKAVLRAVKELGYRPNAAARSLVQQRTHTVGALLSDMRNPWFIDLLDSARSELLALGIEPVLVGSRISCRSIRRSSMRSSKPASTGLLCLGTMPVTDDLVVGRRQHADRSGLGPGARPAQGRRRHRRRLTPGPSSGRASHRTRPHPDRASRRNRPGR